MNGALQLALFGAQTSKRCPWPILCCCLYFFFFISFWQFFLSKKWVENFSFGMAAYGWGGLPLVHSIWEQRKPKRCGPHGTVRFVSYIFFFFFIFLVLFIFIVVCASVVRIFVIYTAWRRERRDRKERRINDFWFTGAIGMCGQAAMWENVNNHRMLTVISYRWLNVETKDLRWVKATNLSSRAHWCIWNVARR